MLRFLIVLLAAGIGSAPPAIAETPTAPTIEAILSHPAFEARIRELVISHPEWVDEGVERKKNQERRATLKSLKGRLTTEDDPFLGASSPSAPTMVWFVEPNCWPCRNHLSEIDKVLAARPDLRIAVKFLPVEGDSASATRILLALRGPRWAEVFRAAMGRSDRINGDTVVSIAGSLGLPNENLEAKARRDVVDAITTRTLTLGSDLRIRDMPVLIVGNEVVTGTPPASEILRLAASARR